MACSNCNERASCTFSLEAETATLHTPKMGVDFCPRDILIAQAEARRTRKAVPSDSVKI